MKTLIIPDIHLDIVWADEMLRLHQPDRVILLGDYFDPSPRARGRGQTIANPGQSQAVVIWLANLIEEFTGEVIPLIGNHDAPYLFPDFIDVFGVSNFSQKALEEIEELPDEMALIRSRAKWFYFDNESGYLFSLAGVSAKVFAKADGSVTATNIERLIEAGMAYAEAGRVHPAFGVGRSRGGNQKAGGLTWLDFNDEFKPVPGFKQIVGHTFQNDGARSVDGNYAIDGIQSTVALIQDGKLEILIDDETKL